MSQPTVVDDVLRGVPSHGWVGRQDPDTLRDNHRAVDRRHDAVRALRAGPMAARARHDGDLPRRVRAGRGTRPVRATARSAPAFAPERRDQPCELPAGQCVALTASIDVAAAPGWR